MSLLPFLSASGLSGPMAHAPLSSPGCLQMPTQLDIDYVYLCVCACRGWCLSVCLPVNADVSPRAHGVSVCACVTEVMYQCALVPEPVYVPLSI